MLTGKYISVNEIIEGLYASEGYEYDLPFADLLQWTADAINLIGYPEQYIKRIKGHKDYTPFDITQYRAQLPCDFHLLTQIAVDGFPAYPANHSFHHLMDGDCCGIDDLGTNSDDGDSFTDNFGNVFNTALGTKYNSEPVTYTLNNNWLTLSVKTGKVCMSYWAFPTDDNGYPMIPDDVSYKEYVKKYLAHKLDWIEYRKGTLSKDIYEKNEQQYMWYCGQATNKAGMPDQMKLENLKNQLLRLLPKIDVANRFFRDLSLPESRTIR